MDNLLIVNNLKVLFSTEDGVVTAVEDVSFEVQKGETLGIVGESGCGKSVTAESIMRLLPEKTTTYKGEVVFNGENILHLNREKMRRIRGNKISMVFQDPMTSLNPVQTIGDQIVESIVTHQKVTKSLAYETAIEMLRLTGIPSPEKRVREYPHELSGGMRQRVLIAMALVSKPQLIIADEPTTALDVTIQAQILELLSSLQSKFKMGVIMITHDLGVVAEICDRVIVMYLGQVIEESDVVSLFNRPLHPYTKGLLKSIPHLEGDRSKKLHVIPGVVPPLTDIPKGCRFATRCIFADDLCSNSPPKLIKTVNGKSVRCWHYEKINKREEEYESGGTIHG